MTWLLWLLIWIAGAFVLGWFLGSCISAGKGRRTDEAEQRRREHMRRAMGDR